MHKRLIFACLILLLTIMVPQRAAAYFTYQQKDCTELQFYDDEGNVVSFGDFQEDVTVVIIGRDTCGNCCATAKKAYQLAQNGYSMKVVWLFIEPMTEKGEKLQKEFGNYIQSSDYDTNQNKRLGWSMPYITSNSVTLPFVAIIDRNHQFYDGWTGYDIQRLEKDVKENQRPAEEVTVSVKASFEAGGTVAGAGTYVKGDTVRATATANADYDFMYWTENGIVVSTEATYEFSVDQNRNLVAEFEKITQYAKMYRLYNPNSGEHFYTANSHERNQLAYLGWNYEGVAWRLPETSNTPVYRLYNPNAGDHHYTTNAAERDMLIAVGWNDEGIGWYSDEAEGEPLYRLYNPNAIQAGAHHYTTNAAERDMLVSIGWRDEGIGWYGGK